MGGAAFPTQVKLSPPQKKEIDAVIINGAECEPYLTADHRVMVEKADEVVLGLKAILKALNVEKGYIGIENNKPDAIEAINKALGETSNISIYSLATNTLRSRKTINSCHNRARSSFRWITNGCRVVVQNIGTVVAIANTIITGMPLVERVVTITGSAIKEPQNLLVRLGTTFSEIIEQCGVFPKPGKLLWVVQ